jgi:DNA polymerase I
LADLLNVMPIRLYYAHQIFPTTTDGDLYPQTATMLMILVDGHSLAFRSYYAHRGKEGGLKTSTGIPTSVCFGFIKSLVEIVSTHKPDCLAIAFDLPDLTFRHQADPNYKGDRGETPEDFIPDLENLVGLLTALNLPIVTVAGFEADDVIGTLSLRGSVAGYQVKIVSGDKDTFQLVDDRGQVSVLYLSSAYARSGGISEIDTAGVVAKMGVNPGQIIDYKALCGDKSDCIPGVRGIGDKTAVKLLTEYGDLDRIYRSIAEIKGSTGTKLEEGKESAYHSQFLATIVRDIPIDLDLDNTALTGFDFDLVEPLLKKLELNRFVKDLEKIQILFNRSGSSLPERKDAGIEMAVEVEDDRDDLWFFSPADTLAAETTDSQIDPQIIDTPAKLTALITILNQHRDRPVAWDTETTDLDPRRANLVGIGCCWGEGETEMAYIPIGHQTGTNLDLNLVLTSLKPILESIAYPKIFQNTKFDRLVLKHQGINIAGVIFDPMLASYVLNPDSSHNLTDLSQRYLGIIAQSYTELVPKGKNISDISIPKVANYCGMDVWTTYQLHDILLDKLKEAPSLLKVLLDIEIPLEPVLAQMEDRGMTIDPEYLKELALIIDRDLAQIETDTYQSAGVEFNLGSPKQLSEVLFDRLGLDPKGVRKTKTGYSTDAPTLEKLQGQHPVIDRILKYRTFAKLKSTYVDALPALIDPETGRVHTDFNQVVTSTGRLSSSNPNLQNIPIRTEFSRQIRKAFIPQAGWILAAADYSQIELRILAHLSQEPVLITAYQQGEDIHTVTARLLFETDTITSEQRRLGKIINFGVIYGMGAARFARDAGIKKAESQVFIDRFYARYPGIFEYLERVKREAIAQGYVETICGRRRYFNFEGGSLRRLKGTNPDDIDLDRLGNLGQIDAGLLRAAANAPIQGSSADIIKLAMVKIDRLLKDYQAAMLLQVHDELVLEMPASEWPELSIKIKETMENSVNLSVPLVVEIDRGSNWMEAK